MSSEIPLKVTDVSSFDSWTHVAAVSVPAVHELVPDTVYPSSHVGWHVDPNASELVQSPTPPFKGAVDASQSLGSTTCTEYDISKP